ncbi:FMN-binding protein [Candidatus Latescibacterota bacterium]
MKKTKLLILAIMGLLFCSNVFAITLLTKEQALKEMFPDVDEIKTINHTLTDAEIAVIKERMGGHLVHFQKGSESEAVADVTTYDFLVGIKDGKPVRMALMEEQPGKWGPVIFIIAIDTTTGKVNNLAVTELKEKRGKPIARNNFLKQFFGKGSSDHISVKSGKGIKRDIRKVSGATISCDCVCFAVRKVLAIYEDVYVKNNLAVAL